MDFSTKEKSEVDNNSIIEDDIDNIDSEYPEKITTPFDPSKIRVKSKIMIVDTLLKRMGKEGEVEGIELTPDFQRKAGLWSDETQSQLIESLLIGIPLPAFYMDATNNNKWLVVDGLQRLTTLKRFMLDKKLKLRGLEFLLELEGKSYHDMYRNHRNWIRDIEETEIIVYLIEEGTPPDVKFNIFKRINTGGLPLSIQEIRHALYQGNATNLLGKLVNSKEFKDATISRITDERMAARAFILRWIVGKLYYPNLGVLDSSEILNNTMDKLNNMHNEELNILERIFKEVMRSIYDIFGKYAFVTHYRNGIWMTGQYLNKDFFEAFSINFATLDREQRKMLVVRKELLKESFRGLMSKENNNTYYHYLQQHRFGKVRQLILEVLP
jgi:uncharacterized protein with ParB-like and HNH nuclease domain